MFSLYFCAGFHGSHGLEQACIYVCIYMFIHERVPAYVCICLCRGVVFSFTYPSLFPALFLTVRKREGRLTGGVGAPLCFFQWWWRWPFLRVTSDQGVSSSGGISSIHVELNSKELSRQEPVWERLILYLQPPDLCPQLYTCGQFCVQFCIPLEDGIISERWSMPLLCLPGASLPLSPMF